MPVLITVRIALGKGYFLPVSNNTPLTSKGRQSNNKAHTMIESAGMRNNNYRDNWVCTQCLAKVKNFMFENIVFVCSIFSASGKLSDFILATKPAFY
jgi:hypothetical protein